MIYKSLNSTQTIETLNVYGGVDGLMNGLVELKVE